MDLTKMYDIQKGLMEKIDKKHPADGEDRSAKKFVGMLTEFAECVNEHRGFKFWSTDQKARTQVNEKCWMCQGCGDMNYEMIQEAAEGNGGHEYMECEECGGTGVIGVKNLLLEEYVDGIHWILEHGIDYGFRVEENYTLLNETENIELQFIECIYWAVKFFKKPTDQHYSILFAAYLGLGNLFGFSTDLIESAYMEKNLKNLERQDNGY